MVTGPGVGVIMDNVVRGGVVSRTGGVVTVMAAIMFVKFCNIQLCSELFRLATPLLIIHGRL